MHSLQRFRLFLVPRHETVYNYDSQLSRECTAEGGEMTCVDFTKPALKDLKRFRFELYAFLMAELELDGRSGLAEGGEVFRFSERDRTGNLCCVLDGIDPTILRAVIDSNIFYVEILHT